MDIDLDTGTESNANNHGTITTSETGTTTRRRSAVAVGSSSAADSVLYSCQFQVPSSYSSLSGQQDLLSKFNLTSVYDEFVGSFLPSSTTDQSASKEKAGVSLAGKPEKRFHEWIVDVGGYCPPRPDRDPQRQSLAALFRPDYAPLAPVDQNAVDDDEIRAAFGGFIKGDLEGWDQGVWETSDNPHQKKKKKRRQHHGSSGTHAIGNTDPAQSGQQGGNNKVKISLKSNLAHSLSSPLIASEDEHRKKKRRKE